MPQNRSHTHAETAQNVRTGKSRRYSKAQKIQAVTIMLAYGGMTIEAKKEINKLFNSHISESTLSQWNKQFKQQVIDANPSIAPQIDVSEIVAQTRETLLVNLASVAQKYSSRLNEDELVKTTSARDSAVVMGISTEKLLLLVGQTPELLYELKGLQDECVGSGYDPLSLIQDLRKAIKARKQAQFEAQNVELIEAGTITDT